MEMLRHYVTKNIPEDMNEADAREHIYNLLERDPKLFAQLAWPLIKGAVWRAVRNHFRRTLKDAAPVEKIRRFAGQRAAESYENGQRQSSARAMSYSNWKSMNFMLPSGVILGDAVKKDLFDAGMDYERQSESAQAVASWLRMIAARMPSDTSRVSEVLGNQEIELFAQQAGVR